MIIIWGHRNRTTTLGSGDFHCPSCDRMQPYERKRIGRYFTLYFVPLFRVKTVLEYLECRACRKTYRLEDPRPAETVAA